MPKLFNEQSTKEKKQRQLTAVKQATKKYIEKHNRLVSMLWNIEYKILEPTANKILLEKKRKTILDILKSNNSEEVIKQKFQEIVEMEKELGNQVNIHSPSFAKL